MEKLAVSFTKVQVTTLNKVQDLLDSLIGDENAKIDIWTGTQDNINPKTGEVTGKRQTANVDLYVDEKQYDEIEKAISFLSNSGQYLTGNFYGTELIAIKARILANKAGEERGRVITFTKQNIGRVTTIADGKERFEKAFANSGEVMRVDAEEEVAEEVSNSKKRF